MNRQQLRTLNKLAARGIDIDTLIKQAVTAKQPEPKPEGWNVQGLTLPEGAMVRTWHHGERRPYWGEVKGGKLVIRKKTYDTPSAAATEIFGRPTNGFAAFECMMPGGKHWRRLAVIRDQHIRVTRH